MNRSIVVVLFAAVIAGCGGTPQRPSMSTLLGKPTEYAREGRHTTRSFSLDLPSGWLRRPLSDDAVAASLDGFLLQTIGAERRDPAKAFPRTKRAARADALSTELAEQEIAELKAAGPQLAALELLENEPASLGGEEGFRIVLRHRTSRGLVLQRIVQAAATKSGYYRVEYVAPALYYYARTLPDFERSVESFAFVPVPSK